MNTMMSRIPVLTALLLAGMLVSCFGGERTIRFTSWDKVRVDEGQVLPYTVLSSGQGMGWLIVKRILIQEKPSNKQLLNTLLSALKDSGGRQGSGVFEPGSGPKRVSLTNAIKITAFPADCVTETDVEPIGTAIWGPKGEFREPVGEDEPYAIRILLGLQETE